MWCAREINNVGGVSYLEGKIILFIEIMFNFYVNVCYCVHFRGWEMYILGEK